MKGPSVAKIAGDFFKNYKAVIAITVFVAIVFFVIYKMGKKAGDIEQPDAVTLPPDTQDSSTTRTWNPGPYTDAVWEDITSWGTRSLRPYRDLLNMSNSQLVAVYNDWNKRYFKEDKETLIQALENEHLSPMSVFSLFEFNTLKNQILSRLKPLISNQK